MDEGVATSFRGQYQQHTLTSGKRSPDLRSAVTRDIKEVLKKSFLKSTQQAATEMASRTGSPASKNSIMRYIVVGSTNRYLKSILNGGSQID